MTVTDLRLTVDTRLGEEFAIRLDSIPGTGAIWHVAQGPGGADLVREISESHGTDIRSPATQTFVFRSTLPGTHELRFELKRGWEREVRRRAVAVVSVSPPRTAAPPAVT